MRWVTAALMIALVLGCASAQEPVYYESNPVLEWDPGEQELLPDDTMEYEVYLWDYSQGDPTARPVDELIYFGRVATPRVQLDFERRARWAIAVRTVVTDGGGNAQYSEPAYTTVAGDTASGVPFVVVPTIVWVPERVGNLRLTDGALLLE